MHKRVIKPIVIGLVFLLSAGTAAASVGQPVRVTGLTYDGWGSTVAFAETHLKSVDTHIDDISCVGAIIAGNERNSSWVDGGVRYWDKVYCNGRGKSPQSRDFCSGLGLNYPCYALFNYKIIYDATGAEDSDYVVRGIKGSQLTPEQLQ